MKIYQVQELIDLNLKGLLEIVKMEKLMLFYAKVNQDFQEIWKL